jgi:hypothetical protein
MFVKLHSEYNDLVIAFIARPGMFCVTRISGGGVVCVTQ